MSNDSARLLAAKVRLDYQKQRVARLAARQPTALASPEVQGVIDSTDGTLNKDVLDAPLDVVIEAWANLPDPIDDDVDTLQLEMAIVDDSGVGDFVAIGEGEPYNKDSTFPTTLKVAQTDYPRDGKRQLRYRIDRYNSSTPEYSPPVDLIFDKTPPWDADEPEAATINANVVTEAFLEANPSGLTVTLPAYLNQSETDTYALYYSDTVPVEDDIPPPVSWGDLPQNRELFIGKDYIENLGDGRFYIVYILLDKATNRSRISKIAQVYVNLGLLPTNLQPPVVPLAADGLVDLADAQTGVTVEVSFTNQRQTDLIEITWGLSKPFDEPIGGGAPPFVISVPHDRLRSAYGNAQDAVDTVVSYRVLRHGVAYGPEETTVKVDFSVAGPGPGPDWPDPVNPALEAPVVRGSVSATDNVLNRRDTGADATFTFKRYAGAEDGEKVDFYYAGTLVDEAAYTVNLNDPDTLVRSLPWSYILNAGNNPALPVHYTIRKPAGAGNKQNSPAALVDANAVIIVADAPVFQRKFGKFLNCDALWEESDNPAGEPAFKVFVPPLRQYLPTGGDVHMLWTAWGGRSGEDNEFEEARLPATVTITAEQAEVGFYWEVKPYDTHILPIYDPDGHGKDGRGRVKYCFEYNGETIYSDRDEALVSLGTGSGTCPIP
ncbi:hypothetical protein [Pseudomonas sp. NPDC090592]|uniref:hypothetical protein n=1 Tax=Pseudomonas sp. NPDC090592 TaxID=3364480 RepID=UPI00383B2768